MGIATSDFNKDLFPDYYITNIGPNALRLSSETNKFIYASDALAIENDMTNNQNTTGWGCLSLDVDNDGLNDLFISNGYIGSADFKYKSPRFKQVLPLFYRWFL